MDNKQDSIITFLNYSGSNQFVEEAKQRLEIIKEFAWEKMIHHADENENHFENYEFFVAEVKKILEILNK